MKPEEKEQLYNPLRTHALYLIGDRTGKKPENINMEDIKKGILLLPKGVGCAAIVRYDPHKHTYLISFVNNSLGRKHYSFIDLYHELSPHFNFYSI